MNNANINLPGYRIRNPLYVGSRTLVYRGIREADQLSVIVKLLREEYPSFAELIRFRNQYAIAQNLPPSCAVKPLALERYRRGYALVMEDVGSISLADYLTQTAADQQHRTPLPIKDFLAIAVQLAESFSQLHHCRVIHKDIKPANILIHPKTLEVKLIDFSISSLLPKETPEIHNPKVLEGTLAYISPEQTGRMNRGIDYRCDFYSLGVTFYELLTGQLPFVSEDPMELIYSHIAKTPPTVAEINPTVPLMISEIVSKLMAKNAEDRYQSGLGLKQDLQRCLDEWEHKGQILLFPLGEKDRSDRFLIPEKLYGREREVKTLLGAFDRIAEGKAELILVAGFSGIGKTAVVNEINKPIVRQRGYFIKGKFDQFHHNIPLSAFVQALRDLIRQLLSQTDEQLELWKTKILRTLGKNGRVIADVIPELEQIIGPQHPVPELSGGAAQNRFNLLFQKFIEVFATSEHPLAIFLDDLQWADSASLKLMQMLMSQSSAGYLLMIGAYRDSEVSPAHPLMVTVEELKRSPTTIHTLTLLPLSVESVNQLVADTLQCSPETAQTLGELVYQKTRGNPFFTAQFLKALHEDGLITFGFNSGYWECDIAKIRQLALTDDVVEFMALQLQKLPEATQDLLKLAACIGNEFDLETLAIVCKRSEAETAALLWKALQEGLILPQTQVYKFYLQPTGEQQTPPIVSLKFLHDRVQQAAYSLIPDDLKHRVHLHIGRLLLNSTNPSQQEEKIFDIVSQLNYGSAFITEPKEREELARLNLLAGQKAKHSAAYESAYEYFQRGREFLTENCWKTQYRLTADLFIGAAEAACLHTNYEGMKAIADIALAEMTDIQDRVEIQQLLILYYHTQSRFVEAVNLAVETLAQLGEFFPKHPDDSHLFEALNHTKNLIEWVGIDQLDRLPPMENPEKWAAMKILRWSCYPAYFAVPEILGLFVCRLLDLTLKYGRSPMTCFAYGIFSVLINGKIGDIATGAIFGELAIAVEGQQTDLQYRAVTYNACYGLSRHFYKPVRESLQPLAAGYESFAHNGDAESSAYCVINAYFCSILAGQNLYEIQEQFEPKIKHIITFKQEQVIKQLYIWTQAIENLTGKGENRIALKGDYFDIDETLPNLYQTKNYNTINYVHIAQSFLAYLFGDYEKALAHARETEPLLAASSGKFLVFNHNLYYSLSLTALYSQQSEECRRQYWEKLQSNQKQMRIWADHCPENFEHKFLLVQAEIARISDNKTEAIDLYDRAIAKAKENGFFQEEALANELAAKFYLGWGKAKIAAAYLTDAYYGFAHWGASTKAEDLETRYPQLRPSTENAPQPGLNPLETVAKLTHLPPSMLSASTHITSLSASLGDLLDFTSVLKAAQAISSSIQLEELIGHLTQVILENSGAETCVLLLPEGNKLQIRAVTQLTSGSDSPVTELQSAPLIGSEVLPVRLIQYVRRTQEPIIINHRKIDIPGVVDEYLLERQPQSVLCTPILNRANLVGVLYLEHAYTKGVFTRDRLQVLNFLCTQAGISLENARLYQQATQALADLQAAQLRLIQTEKMSSLGQTVAGIAHEINNPIGFIAGNLNEAKGAVSDLIAHLNLYRNGASQMEILDHAEEIDLEYLIEDAPKMIDSMKLGCDRIKEISAGLRIFSRSDRDYPIPADIHQGIDSTLLILKHRLKRSQLRPEIEVIRDYGDLPNIECFPGQLNQVFMNILANGIDALDESCARADLEGLKVRPKSIKIKTEMSADQQSVVIRISDNGTGISEEVKTKIFDYLFTTKAAGKGTGLGLAIVHQIVVEKHGGAIAVNSTLGEGTEFVIALPVKAKTPTAVKN